MQDAGLMWRQNETLRRHCRGRFADLLNASVREPALLLYLDAQANRKGHANENLARELMELFTLGVGNYSEADVKEAARALTGWTVDDGQFLEVAARHDTGAKTILGATGEWKGSDLIAKLLHHPATADRIAQTLSRQFFGEKAISPEAVRVLAADLREHDLDIGWAVETILRSRLFFADANLGTRDSEPGRVRRRQRAGARPVRPGAEHARSGRLVGSDGPGPVRPAQRRRLAAGPGVDSHPRA